MVAWRRMFNWLHKSWCSKLVACSNETNFRFRNRWLVMRWNRSLCLRI